MSSFSPQQAGYSAHQSGWQQHSPAPVAESPTGHGIQAHPEFRSMRGSYRRFGATAVALAVGGFLLYVLLSSFAPDVMNLRLAGHLTLGLALGLAQFGVMALVVWRYTVHMRRRIDPVAHRMRELERRETAQPRQPRVRGYRSW